MNIFKLTSTSIALILSSQAFAGQVNINQASAQQLDEELHGVGPAIAQRIVEYRQTHGAFTQSAQLMDVKGIGEKTLSKNAQYILLK